MRILVLVTDAFGGTGGIAKFNRDLIRALCAHPDCAEVVAIPRLMTGPLEPLPDKLTYVTAAANSKMRFIWTSLKAVRKNPRFDLVVCGHINLVSYAGFLSEWIHAPLWLEIYGIDAWEDRRGWVRNRFLRRMDAFTSISEITLQRFLNWAPVDRRKGHLLPNAIDISEFGARSERPDLVKRYRLRDKTVIMTLGRMVALERYKGFDETLELLPRLAEEVPNLVYLIGGDGPDRPRLEKKTRRLGVQDRVIFTGFIPEQEKADYYRLADAYVMPSHGEGFGFVFLEAMASGVPVLGSKLDGGREALDGGRLGTLVDPNVAEELKEGILATLKKPKGVVPPGLEKFSFENFRSRCHQIVDTIVHRTASHS